jgi:hypothetical protein
MDEDIVAAKLDTVAAKLETVQSKVEGKPKENWRNVAVQLIAIPSAVLLLYIQFHQARTTPLEEKKTAAEIEKLELESKSLQAKTDLDANVTKLLDALKDNRTREVAALQQELRQQTLPQLEQALEHIETLNRQETSRINQNLFAKYVVLYIFWNALRLFFNVVDAFWRPLLGVSTAALYSSTERPGKTERSRRHQQVRRKIMQFVLPILSQAPSILHTAIEVGLFAIVFVPFFNELMLSLGHGESFRTVAGLMARLQIGDALRLIHNVVLGQT